MLVAQTLGVVGLHPGFERVDENEIGVRIGSQALPDDALDRRPDAVGIRLGVIGREVHEDEIGLVTQHLVPEPVETERAPSRAAVDVGQDAANINARILVP